MEMFWEALRLKVCRACLDGDGEGNCRLPVGETCALEVFLPELVEFVSTNPEASHETYVELLGKTICVYCDHQVSDGTCAKRQSLECALDRYYPTIIEIIGTVKTTVAGSGTAAFRKL